MPEFIAEFLQTTPFEILLAYALLTVAVIPITGVLILGFAQVWLYRKQDQYWTNLKWHLLSVSVPQDAIQTPKGMVNFFNNIAGSKSAITWKEKWLHGKFQAYFSLEIISTGGRITFYIRTQEKYRDLAEASFYAQYPDAQIIEVEDYVSSLPNDYPNDEYDLWGSEFLLKKDDIFPIKTWEMFEHQGEKDQRFKDPMLPLLENFGKLREGEHFWLQILCMQPDEQSWREKGVKFINDKYGKEEAKKAKGGVLGAVSWIPKELLAQTTGLLAEPEQADKKIYDWTAFKITPEEKERIEGVTRKIASLGWLTKIRFVYVAKHDLFRKGSMAALAKGIFHQYRHQGLNYLSLHDPSTPKDDYFYQEWQMPMKQRRLMKRFQSRAFGPGSTPYILNSEELATIFHFPTAEARTPVLTTLPTRLAEPPVELEFAREGEPELPNLERTQTDVVGVAAPVLPESPTRLVVPKPVAPTEQAMMEPAAVPLEPGMPRPGMPAPLPPGLDLAEEPLEENPGSPRNLPL